MSKSRKKKWTRIDFCWIDGVLLREFAKTRLDASEDETLDYSKWFNDSAAWLNDLLTRAAIIWSTSITAINSIELYNLPAMIGGGGLRRNFEMISCLLLLLSLPRLLFHSANTPLSFTCHPSPHLYPVRRPGLGEVISRIRWDDELSRSALPLFCRAR